MAFEDVEFQSAENPDWGYARNLRAALITPSGEWVQSIFSGEISINGKLLIAPNRDYPYEGMLGYQDGENWKFIDCVAVGIRSTGGQYLSFSRDPAKMKVLVNPWRVTYHYTSLLFEGGRGPIEVPFWVSYYLHSACPPGMVSGCVEAAFLGDAHGLHMTLQPFLDVRHMYAGSQIAHYWMRSSESSFHIGAYNRALSFHFPGGAIRRFVSPEYLNWWYKLGNGERQEAFNPDSHTSETIFVGENKTIAAFFDAQPNFSKDLPVARLFVSCHIEPSASEFTIADLDAIHRESIANDDIQRTQVANLLPAEMEHRDAILARVVGLIKFKTYIRNPETNKYVPTPHAGAWWFRTPWYRDVFEGLLNSIETLMSFSAECSNIREIILLALSYQNKDNGLIPNRMPEFKNQGVPYDSSDATLLCYVVASNFLLRAHDDDLASAVILAAMRTISCFTNAAQTPVRVDGPPRLHSETGLLLSAPHYSWMDTRTRSVEHAGYRWERLPNRVSRAFVESLADHVSDKAAVGAMLSSPRFFLPEINAQWIKALTGIEAVLDRAVATPRGLKIPMSQVQEFGKTVTALRIRAEHSFPPVFWNQSKGFLFNVVFENQSVRDEIESEPAVVASGMLAESIFSSDKLKSIWECANARLVMHRRLVKYGNETVSFGIVAKNENQGPYYNDEQYHSDVLWPRSTPYLLKLLRALGDEEAARRVLTNALDHQMSEGAIFYSHELLSRPLGNNPSAVERTGANPVPVKNPIQFWSQWCDQLLFSDMRRLK
jgi:hypothetical protein